MSHQPNEDGWQPERSTGRRGEGAPTPDGARRGGCGLFLFLRARESARVSTLMPARTHGRERQFI